MENNIQYSGEVSVTLLRDGKPLISQTGHNHGGTFLFRCIAYALAGKFDLSKKFSPCKVRLFYDELQTDDDPDTIADCEKVRYEYPWLNMDDNGKETPKKMIAKSDFVYINTKPDIYQNRTGEQKNENSWSVIYHFLIPYSYIYSSTSSNNKINAIGLFFDEEDYNDASKYDKLEYYQYTALYYLENTINLNDELENIKNLSFAIDWKMTIGNKEEISK